MQRPAAISVLPLRFQPVDMEVVHSQIAVDQTLRTDRALMHHDIGLRRFARTTWRGLLPRSAASIAENGAVRHSAPLPTIRPRTRKIDHIRLECQFAGAALNSGEADLGIERAITRDDQTVSARFEGEPMRYSSGASRMRLTS